MGQRTVHMYLGQGGATIYTYAICPLHGKKYLTRITARQAMSKGQQYRKRAEELFLTRAGTTREHVYFVWKKGGDMEDKFEFCPECGGLVAYAPTTELSQEEYETLLTLRDCACRR